MRIVLPVFFLAIGVATAALAQPVPVPIGTVVEQQLVPVPAADTVVVPPRPALAPQAIDHPEDCQWQSCNPPRSRQRPGPRFQPPPRSNPTPRINLPPESDAEPERDRSDIEDRLDAIEDALERIANQSSKDPEPEPTPENPGCQCNLEPIYKKLAELSAKLDALANNEPTQPKEPSSATLAAILEQLNMMQQQIAALSQQQADPPDNDDLSEVQAQLEAVKKKLEQLANNNSQTVNVKMLQEAFAAIQRGLTELNAKLDNDSGIHDKIADALVEMAKKQTDTNAKLDAAIELLKKGPKPAEVTLKVQSTPNLPASYVDVSTIWAVERKTGLSHAVLVMNSADPDWERLEPAYERAKHKFPAIQRVDVQAEGLKISPTPQLVLYYLDDERDPQVISGDRRVGAKLRELYTN